MLHKIKILQRFLTKKPRQLKDLDGLKNTFFIGFKAQIIGRQGVHIGENSIVGNHVWINNCCQDSSCRIKIGRNVILGRGSMVSSASFLEIGDFTITGPYCCFSNADHDVQDLYSPILQQGAKSNGNLIIEENCWIGFGVIIVKPVRVGRGSIVAAGSVVLEDIPPFSVYAGNPARLKKMYNFEKNKWELIRSKDDYQSVLGSREVAAPPSRKNYLNLLNKNNIHTSLDAELAG